MTSRACAFPHRSRNAHARLVIAIDVAAHSQLGLFLRRVQQLLDVVGVAKWIAGAPRGSSDGARLDSPPLHAHEHLRRRADQLLIAKLQEELVRTWTRLLDARK